MRKVTNLMAITILFPIYAFAEIDTILPGLNIIPSKGNINQFFEEEKLKGYQENNFNNAKFLLNFKSHAKQEIIENKTNEYGSYDTHLKKNYSEIKLAFKFNGLKGIDESKILGYAAIGSYVKDEKRDGWNGLKVFFDEPSIGTCSYAYNEFYGAQLYEEFIEYSVNNKPTQTLIEGNQTNGFLYVVEWFSNKEVFTLECANKEFDKNFINTMIRLGKMIDKN